MTKTNSNHLLWVGIATFCFMFIMIRGCPMGRSVDASKLPGVWRTSEQGIDVIWTFESNGSFRYQAQFKNGWIGFVTGNFDIPGHWKLDHGRLTIELADTPPAVAMWGGNWNGETTTFQIQLLTDQELAFTGSDWKFRRSLVPVGK